MALGLLADVNSLDELKPSSSSSPSPSTSMDKNTQHSHVSAPPALIHAKSGRILRDSEGKVIGVDIPGDDEPSREAMVEGEDTPWGAPISGNDRQLAPILAKTSVAIGTYLTIICVSKFISLSLYVCRPLGAWRFCFSFSFPFLSHSLFFHLYFSHLGVSSTMWTHLFVPRPLIYRIGANGGGERDRGEEAANCLDASGQMVARIGERSWRRHRRDGKRPTKKCVAKNLWGTQTIVRCQKHFAK